MALSSALVDEPELPLSRELLTYYQARVAASEDEMASLRTRIEEVGVSKNEAHRIRWELQKRSAEVAELQRALSDSHIYVWEERDKCLRLQAENDELRIQEAEDRRKIQHLLSLVEPLTHDATFVRTQAPECVFLHPQTRVTSSAPVPGAALSAHTGESKAGQVWSTRVESVGISGNRVGGVERAGIAGKSGKSVGAGDSSTRMSSGGGICQPRASRAQSAAAVPGGALSPTIVGTTSGKVTADSEGATRVLRTIYMPNEKVDSLLLSIESLRAQLAEQDRLARERVGALLEDRRLRIAEEENRRATESEQMRKLEEVLQESERLLHKHTEDYLNLRHESLARQRADAERIEELRQELAERNEELAALRTDTANEVQLATVSAKQSAEEYVNLFRKQVTDTERTMGLLTAEHNSLQQALGMRIKELEEMLARLQKQHSALETRRRLEGEGYARELALLQKQLAKLELRTYGKSLSPEPMLSRAADAPNTIGAPPRGRGRVPPKKSQGVPSQRRLRSEIGATRARMAALERATEC